MDKDLNLAVLIDGDNIPSAYVKEMMEEIAKYGNPSIRRIYGDWTKPNLSKWKNMLLENAIPYRVWKRRLKKDLTIQRFLKDRLVNNQEISPGDMIAFYDAYRKQVGTGNTADIDEGRLVEMLRLEKSQAAYDNWIASLKTAYPVSIDKAVLAEFLVNQSLTKKNTPNQD